MHEATTAALEARLEILSVALHEVARPLAPAQAARVAVAVRQRVAELIDTPPSPAPNEAITVVLAHLLAALRALPA